MTSPVRPVGVSHSPTQPGRDDKVVTEPTWVATTATAARPRSPARAGRPWRGGRGMRKPATVRDRRGAGRATGGSGAAPACSASTTVGLPHLWPGRTGSKDPSPQVAAR